MKPVCVTMQAFGSYLESTVVDFTELGETPLFLITGPTGGGKTTILDAICFALYCRSTGGRRSWSGMRCTAAPPELDTVAEFVFTLPGEPAVGAPGDAKTRTAGERYKFRRVQSQYKARGKELWKTREEHACYRWDGQAWELLCSGAESRVRDYAEQLLGLTCEQFSQVIVLPQGDFLKLLLASSREKAALFQTLFATRRWEAATARLKTQAAALQKQADALTAERTAILSREGCANAEMLSALAEDLEQKEKRASALLQRNKKELDAANTQYEQARQLAGLFAEYRQAAALKKKLEEQRAQMEQWRARLDQARRAMAVYPYVCAQSDASRLLDQKQRAARQARERLQAARERLERAQKGQGVAQEARQTASALEKELLRLDAALAGAQRLQQARTREKQVQLALSELERQKDRAQKAQRQAEDQVKKGEEFVDSLQRQSVLVATLSEQVMQGDAAGTLARSLENGLPCPVCGSVHHPSPALAQQRLDSLREKLDESRRAANLLPKAQQRLAQRRGELKQAQEDMELCRANAAGLEQERSAAQAQIAELERGAAPGETAKALTVQREETRRRQEERLKQAKDLETELAASQSACAAAAAAWEASEAAQKEAQAAWETAKTHFLQAEKAQGFAPDTDYKALLLEEKDADGLQTKIRTYDQNLESARARVEVLTNSLNGKQEPDEPKALEERDKAQACWEAAAREAGALTQRAQELKKSGDRLEQIETDGKDLLDRYSRAERLSQLLSGKNPKKIPLQQFVLGIMLDDILTSANQFFATLSSGRYSLQRIPEAIGGRALGGLDLRVLDAQRGGARAVETLSGGELFLASLSLAFGLSDVVQQVSGGVHMDSLFIDEGFGSLDQETLDTAMQALGQLHRAGRMIGIISHVGGLQSRIGARVVVSRTPSGGSAVHVVA